MTATGFSFYRLSVWRRATLCSEVSWPCAAVSATSSNSKLKIGRSSDRKRTPRHNPDERVCTVRECSGSVSQCTSSACCHWHCWRHTENSKHWFTVRSVMMPWTSSTGLRLGVWWYRKLQALVYGSKCGDTVGSRVSLTRRVGVQWCAKRCFSLLITSVVVCWLACLPTSGSTRGRQSVRQPCKQPHSHRDRLFVHTHILHTRLGAQL